MIKHIVMWKFKEQAEGATKEENIEKVSKMLYDLKHELDFILELEVGKNVNMASGAFDLVLVSSFENLEKLDEYQIHPSHVAVSQFVSRVREERAVVDYEV